MLASMTGFVRHDTHGQWGTLHWEIRCVNHRYYDPHFRLPEGFAALEPLLRERLQPYLSRGRCDIFLRYLPASLENQGEMNMVLVTQLLGKLQQLAQLTALPTTCNLFDLLRWPGVMQSEVELTDTQSQWVLTSFAEAVAHLQQDRLREGAKLQQLLMSRLDTIALQLQHIQQRVPELLPFVKQRIMGILQPVSGELNAERLEQELIYFAHRLDVSEECDRFHTHVEEFRRRLEQGGAVGRRLDFLLQEMQREINTLGNKANDKTVNQYTVEVKVLIEQIREQVQNVE